MGRRISQTDLIQAIYNCDIAEVKRLLSTGTDLNKACGRWAPIGGATPLNAAIEMATHVISQIAKDVDDVAKVIFPETKPRNFQAERKKYIEIVKYLIEAGADVDLINRSRSPLNLAAFRSDLFLVKLLLGAGANPDGICISPFVKPNPGKMPPNYYCTALHEAARLGSLAVCRQLISAGANFSMPDYEGKTAAERALENRHLEIAEFLKAQIVKKGLNIAA